MERKKVRRLPVIDAKKKRLIGMLSLGDVYNAGPRRGGREAMQGVSAHHT
jgi:CBS domain-containing protein